MMRTLFSLVVAVALACTSFAMAGDLPRSNDVFVEKTVNTSLVNRFLGQYKEGDFVSLKSLCEFTKLSSTESRNLFRLLLTDKRVAKIADNMGQIKYKKTGRSTGKIQKALRGRLPQRKYLPLRPTNYHDICCHIVTIIMAGV